MSRVTPQRRKGPQILHHQVYGNASSANKRRKLDLQRISHARIAGNSAQRDLQYIPDYDGISEELVIDNDESRIEVHVEQSQPSSGGRIRMKDITPTPAPITPTFSDEPDEAPYGIDRSHQTSHHSHVPQSESDEDTIYVLPKPLPMPARKSTILAFDEEEIQSSTTRKTGNRLGSQQRNHSQLDPDITKPNSEIKRTQQAMDTGQLDKQSGRRRRSRYSALDGLQQEYPMPNNKSGPHKQENTTTPSMSAADPDQNEPGRGENIHSTQSAESEHEKQTRLEITRLQNRNIRLEEQLKKLQEENSTLDDRHKSRERMLKDCIRKVSEQEDTMENQRKEIEDLKAMITGMFSSFKSRYGLAPSG